MKITGKTKIVGIFGYPVKHTLSPLMHNAAFRVMRLDYCYVPFEVRPENLKEAMEGIRALNIRGVNITVPHKEAAMDYLDELSAEARLIGAVNTIENRDGRLIGDNTDSRGFIKSLLMDANTKVKGKRVLILGAGGAGKGVAVACAMEKAATVTIANRTADKAERLTEYLKGQFSEIPFSAISLEKDRLPEVISDADILINATSVGLKRGESLPISSRDLHKNLVVYDLIYNPPDTPFLKMAGKAGVKKAVNGLGMLLYQGALSFEIWTGKRPPIAAMKKALF